MIIEHAVTVEVDGTLRVYKIDAKDCAEAKAKISAHLTKYKKEFFFIDVERVDD